VGRDQQPVTSEHDAALWFTDRIVNTLRERRFTGLQSVATPLPPVLGAGEVVLADGGFELMTFRPVGNGGYMHRSTAVLPLGRGVTGLAVGALVAQSVGNRRRRTAAERDAAPRWVVDDRGGLWVSTHGFYLQTARGLFPWPWHSIQAAELTGPGQVHVQGTSESGPVSWIVGSRWAELLFVLWAMVRHPQHPQFTTGTWAPHRRPTIPSEPPELVKHRESQRRGAGATGWS
jgi:hypothetical protein